MIAIEAENRALLAEKIELESLLEETESRLAKVPLSQARAQVIYA